MQVNVACRGNLVLHNMLLAPEIHQNNISMLVLLFFRPYFDYFYSIEAQFLFETTYATFALVRQGLIVVDLDIDSINPIVYFSYLFVHIITITQNICHAKLGHISQHMYVKASEKKVCLQVQVKQLTRTHCLARKTRTPLRKPMTVKFPLQFLHLDVCGQ